jgi:hypothetical protein
MSRSDANLAAALVCDGAERCQDFIDTRANRIVFLLLSCDYIEKSTYGWG